MTNDVIEVRLPPKPEYLPVIRAAVGVIVGTMFFNYDEIIQIRVAAAEAFELAIRQITGSDLVPKVNELTIRFVVGTGRIEIQVPAPQDYAGRLDSEEDREAQALLRSLMDEVEFGVGVADRPIVRAVKYKSTGKAEQQRQQV